MDPSTQFGPETDTTPYEAQQAVISWASYGESFSKIGFLKNFFQSLGMEECHHAKNILAKVLKQPENRKREWVGPNPTGSFKKTKILESEIKSLIENVAVPEEIEPESSTLSRPFVSRRVEEPVAEILCPWWKKYEKEEENTGNRYLQTVGYDVEHVHLKHLSGVERIRGGKVAVVDHKYNAIYCTDVYHAPGSFICNKAAVKVSGIGKYGLKHGKSMSVVAKELNKKLASKLVITVDGSTDFSSVDINMIEHTVFNLQQYYRRSDNSGIGTTGMSLRDIYFMEFGQDFQGINTHSAEEDARATLRCFLEGYVKRNTNSSTCDNDKHFDVFDGAVKLKAKDRDRVFYCNTDRVFKDETVEVCKCNTCQKLFYRK